MDQPKIEQIVEPKDHSKKDQTFRMVHRYCTEIRMRFTKCMQDYNAYENVDAAAKYLRSKPSLLAAIIAVTFAVGLPVLLFTLFAITTIICTFTGFILIEGTILAFGTILLCGVLLSIITSILMLGTCLNKHSNCKNTTWRAVDQS
ncbi:uncharacterized protein LOC124305282 isoform X1 [Neodiprion virginianus]|uniref:uncharacterized protein LOC124182939 isoform X1 n=1 Tax=Neodiprion fabricii TaxID=2872261 RepID=UPI001ED8F5DF|nr:uncharacterized protein LOC124182939 isoform X1 [Neodiprion fabricii]XP_046620483.1 uncharacterized protein LOC124305282 isoform X1 [Neodiprion virginianus]